jgi:hypothetical protein
LPEKLQFSSNLLKSIIPCTLFKISK